MTAALGEIESGRVLQGLARLGDAWIGVSAGSNDRMPRFSETKFKDSLPILLDAMSDADRSDLTLLLTILGYCPKWSMSFFIRSLFFGSKIPGSFGAFFRTVRISLKGLIVTLYYDSSAVLDCLEYQVRVQPKD